MQTVLSSKSSNFNTYEKRIEDELSSLKDKHKVILTCDMSNIDAVYQFCFVGRGYDCEKHFKRNL